MALQERKTEVVLGRPARIARVNDLINKVRCWEGYIRIAKEDKI